jgi:hypothetical protein
VAAIFDNKAEIAAVWKDATNLTPESSLAQLGPEAQKYLHEGSQQYFRAQGALK